MGEPENARRLKTALPTLDGKRGRWIKKKKKRLSLCRMKEQAFLQALHTASRPLNQAARKPTPNVCALLAALKRLANSTGPKKNARYRCFITVQVIQLMSSRRLYSSRFTDGRWSCPWPRHPEPPAKWRFETTTPTRRALPG